MKPFPEVNAFSDILCAWYARFGRDLPWRHTRDPYRIWLSEVILQQTRVEQGREYYLRFVGRFPDVGALAAASEEEVLKLWQGAGLLQPCPQPPPRRPADCRTIWRPLP